MSGSSYIQRVRDALLDWYAAGCPDDPRQGAFDIEVDERQLAGERSAAPPTYRLVVLLMTYYARSDGTAAHPSRTRVMRQAAVSAQTFTRGMAWAMKHGWATRVVRGNQHVSSVYRFHPPDVLAPRVAPAQDGAHATRATSTESARATSVGARATRGPMNPSNPSNPPPLPPAAQTSPPHDDRTTAGDNPRHDHEPNVRRALVDRGWHGTDLDRLVALAYDLGDDGDPWPGYLAIGTELDTGSPWPESTRDPVALLRHRLDPRRTA